MKSKAILFSPILLSAITFSLILDFLAADQQMAAEIQYDLKRFEEQQHPPATPITVCFILPQSDFFLFCM
jgi:hypothetical protein